MNRVRKIGMAMVIMCALAAGAQQAATAHLSNDPSAVERHVQVLGDKLGLTADQRTKITPMLQEMHDAAAKAEQDQSLSDDARNSQMMAAQKRADTKIRTVLTDDQKKKLDELEAEMHQGHAH